MAAYNDLDPLEPLEEPCVPLDEPLLSAAEVARLLGIPRSTVYAHAKRRHDPLPCVQIGRHRRFPRRELEQWVARQRATLRREPW